MILKWSLVLGTLFYFYFIRALSLVSVEDLLHYLADVRKKQNNFK